MVFHGVRPSPTLSNRYSRFAVKAMVHDAREALLHDPVNDLTDLGHIDVLVLFYHVTAG